MNTQYIIHNTEQSTHRASLLIIHIYRITHFVALATATAKNFRRPSTTFSVTISQYVRS